MLVQVAAQDRKMAKQEKECKKVVMDGIRDFCSKGITRRELKRICREVEGFRVYFGMKVLEEKGVNVGCSFGHIDRYPMDLYSIKKCMQKKFLINFLKEILIL
ncbi:unnamed protein product [Moneuplotes crassus]|uniref:Uncharacterized protein n=1 Tax=Euplotes crassus TaxID=5936 RepID=A0AAD2CYJ6_EUPCR|nr:unnamed protein product [Moneuplotes crassus]